MSPREVKQARAHETRQRILVGAASSFAEHGFSGATISDIMERSGVTKGALYFHFDTKEEVADAVLAAHTQALQAAVAKLEGSAPERLFAVSMLACDGLADDPLFQATARLAVERETYGLGRPTSFLAWEDVLKDLFDETAELGLLRPGLDTRVVARMLSAAMLGLHLAARAADPHARLHEEVSNFWQVTGRVLLQSDALSAAGSGVSGVPRSATV